VNVIGMPYVDGFADELSVVVVGAIADAATTVSGTSADPLAA
jgi:hypothetical protein